MHEIFYLKWFGQTNISVFLIKVLKYFFVLVFEFTEIFDFSYILRILGIHTDSFRMFSVYEKIRSAYFQYSNRFILSILRVYKPIHCAYLNIQTDSFRVFGKSNFKYSILNSCVADPDS